MSDPAAEWVIKQIEAHGLGPFAFGVAILTGVGYAVGWGIGIRKANAEIEKVRVETRKASGENIEKLATLRDQSNRHRENVKIAMGTMREALLAHKTPEQLRTCRDEMCNLYDIDYIPAVSKYTEMIPTLVDREECLQRAKTELIPGLKTMCSFLKMVNMDEMLQKTGGSKFLIRREVRDGILNRVYALTPWRCFRLRWRLIKIRKETDQYLLE